MAQITFKGSLTQTIGELPPTGDLAPAFTLCSGTLEDVSLSDYAGKSLVLNIIPSLDTSVCQASARRFNEILSKMEDVVVVNISMDLPFAQARFCSSEGLENVESLSAFRSVDFGEKYGVTIVDGPLKGLLSRAIVVVSPDGKVIFTEQIPEIAQEPDYDAVLNILK